MIKIKLVRSPIGRTEKQKNIVKSLGFRKVNQVIEKKDTPETRGMINQIDYMVKIID